MVNFPLLPQFCYVVVKQTALAQGGRAAQFARQGDATAQRIVAAHQSHQQTLSVVRKTLKQHGIACTELNAKELNAKAKRQLARADFVVTVGGDGTVLNTSHCITEAVMVGVNSAPGDSVGHFCALTAATFAVRLPEYLAGRWRPTTLTRLAVTLDDRRLPELALNDVLIAHTCPAATTRYLINAGKIEEEHRSSGIWIATAAGSTAGIRSAGGRQQPRRSQKIQYRVRELYREVHGGVLRDYQLTHGFIAPDEVLTIASKMPDAWLYLDGARTAYR
ncbi:MAG: NAD(+) kinase, partial [Acidobacteria bacterium]|nr:NAD(+) kinase [Acidobacteriota bacterium]